MEADAGRREEQGGKPGSREGFFQSAPSLSLPKGGGAIRGMGEKFAANPVTGTGSMTVPIATSPGRSGFGPQLSLSYDSGAGNGPFGFGWSLSLPAITRKTDKGLPKYRDADESDVFILSGAEDLVPVLIDKGDGTWEREQIPSRTVDGKTYSIQSYRPRIEGLFARIERWTSEADPKDTFWRSISKDNITTWYGKTEESRIADPADPTRIFSWLICQSHDDKGNAIVYQYMEENSDGVDLSQAHEKNRTPSSRSANRYLKRIHYGNRQPNRDVDWNATDPSLLPNSTWMFEVVFDYEDHDPESPLPEEPGKSWSVRNDPFSSYRAGFEVRTYRLCQRVLMFHHFPEETGVGAHCLVRSTDFTYSYEQDPASARNPIFSFLLAMTHSGYKRQSDSTYLKQSLPPLEFQYSQPVINEEIHEVDPESLENLPYGLDNGRYQWVDLDGEGLSGILTEQAEGWFYKRNLSPLPHPDNATVAARFAPLERIRQKPSLTALGGGGQLLDLAGDGQLDLVELEGPTPGFYERTHDERWESFATFESLPVIDWNNPNLKFVDLTGDGHADILISEDDVFCWHPSLAEAGFGPPERIRKALDEEKGPKLVFADGTQSVYLSDMSGDGLTDLVRIRNGEVCYWPNLGYGRFGAKVTMDNAPWFNRPDLFDQRRVRLADIDGSGITDIIYLAADGVRLYFNESGNRWSPPRRLTAFPQIDNLSSVQVADLLGNGTACLVWSSPLPGVSRRPMRYLDLMGGQKPHLMLRSTNNLGAETQVQYASSTKFYLADKLSGKPWITRLPFPVHVVERVETHDHISRNRFVTRYAYHHGYFDGVEREFRGFGMVEQWDTEEFAALAADPLALIGGEGATNIDATSHVPPVHTKTWFHTGTYVGRDHVSDFYAGLLNGQDRGEYYREPGLSDEEARALLLEDTILPDGLSTDQEREACRALKGSMLRQEVYAEDGTDKAQHPYTVAEQNFTVRTVQPRAGNRHAVFFTYPREALTYHYERNPADPRIQHALTLEVDAFGNVLKSAAIGYGRRPGVSPLQGEDKIKQEQPLLTYTENHVTNPILDLDDYRGPLPCETRTYEITGLTLPPGRSRFTLADVLTAGTGAALLAYEQDPTEGALQKRLIEQVRTLYRPNDLGAAQNGPLALLPLGTVESLALPGESYKLAFTPGLLTKVYRRPLDLIQPPGSPSPENLLPSSAAILGGQGEDRGGYVDLDNDGHWWIPSGRVFFSPSADDTAAEELAFARQHFFVPPRYRDPFHTDQRNTETVVTFDSHTLLTVETRDALTNTVRVQNDYRVLAPRLMTDPNGNRSAVVFDALGLVAGTAVMGKTSETLGDSLANFVPDLTVADLDVFLGQPRRPSPDPAASEVTEIVRDLLKNATTRIVYDLDRFRRTGLPPFAATIAREKHVSDLAAGAPSKLQVSFSYSDGFGREIQKKIQAEPGPLVEGGPEVNPRWVGGGWTIFNNKGKPVRQYEPFFDDTHDFRFARIEGASPILFYDPVERVVATLHPNHTYEKVVFDPWRQETWDVSDTALFADPKTDPDVGDFFRRLPEPEYLPTWHALRTDPAHALEAAQRWPDAKLRAAETAAAAKTALHAATPTIAHADSLGRTFLTIAHNRLPLPPGEGGGEGIAEFYTTRILLDIEGNQREVIDAKDRIVMRYDYDLLGNRIHQASQEAGERWMLNDVTGKPIRAWDSRGFLRRMTYDELRRPLGLFFTDNNSERLAERTVYGESQGEANNHRTRVYQVFDGAGVVTSVAYDYKGNLRETTRELLPDYKNAVDWQQNLLLGSEEFTSHTKYDALNRPIAVTAPDGSIYRPGFNEANLLDRVDVNLRGAANPTPFVTDIAYNPKGQRTSIRYANSAETTYEYDGETFRLIHLKTTRAPGLNGLTAQIFEHPALVQDLHYTYDPAGNITRIADAALQTVIHAGAIVEPVCEYTYDAIYRLIEAKGREHIGQSAWQTAAANGNFRDHPFVGAAQTNDLTALRNYVERYDYDAVGNFEALNHQFAGGGWTRGYEYDEASLIEQDKQSNRLSRTTIGQTTETYAYDPHGNMLGMPHLAAMSWDFEDQLQRVDLGGGGTAYYVYDAAGQRVRKVIERQNGTRQKERIYLGGFEVYREYDGGGAVVDLERETLQVMDDQQRIALVETLRIENSLSLGDSAKVTTRYQLGNHLGSASLELDVSGQMISYEEYHPYGTTSYQAVRSGAEVSAKRYRYTGKERDEETGLYYHGARYYAGWLGRWVSADPAGLVDHLNGYVCTRSNPIRFVDSIGTQSTPPKKLYPAPTGEPGHPFNRFLDAPNPQFQQNWNKAVNEVLEPIYRGGSYEKNIALYKAAVSKLPEKGAKGVLTAGEHARTLFDRSLSKFKGIEAKNPSFNYQGKPPLEGLQVHHDEPIKGTSKQQAPPKPGRALDFDNLIVSKGGEKGGQPKGSTHHYLHHSDNARKLDKFRAGKGNELNMRMGPPGARGFLSLLEEPINEFFGAATGMDLEARDKHSDVFRMTPEQREELTKQRMANNAERAFYDEVAQLSESEGISADEAERRIRAERAQLEEQARENPGPSLLPAKPPAERRWYQMFLP
jgi:RHS repeat-associated protein